LGYLLGDFFTNASGHPVPESTEENFGHSIPINLAPNRMQILPLRTTIPTTGAMPKALLALNFGLKC
jgi:hypothetical protein